MSRPLGIEEWAEQRDHDRRQPGQVCGQCPLERVSRESLAYPYTPPRRRWPLYLTLMALGFLIGRFAFPMVGIH